jgi:hypothetical protein
MRIRNAFFFGSALVLGAAMATASGCGINSTSTAGYDAAGAGSSGRGGAGAANGGSAGGPTNGGAAGAIAGGAAGTGGTSEGKPCDSVDDCDDGNPCTSEACVSKHCAGSPVLPGAECDTDNDRCNGIGSCDGAVCKPKPGSAPNMDDGDPCTVASCDPATGNVTHLAKVKETDNTKCSKAVCDPVSGAVTTVDVDVDDGDACTADGCDLAAGPVHTPVQVGDGNPCTVDKCDKIKGVTHETIPGCKGCGDAPTPEEADASCSDGDPCTRDYCTPGATASDRKCAQEIVENGTNIDDDGTVCNGIDTCEAGKRVAGKSIDVDDNNKCTDDKCDDQTGEVSHVATGFDDNNKCTVDTCDPQQGAIHTPVNADDGDACTTNDRCDPNGKGDGLTSDKIPGCTSCGATADCEKLNKVCQSFTCEGGQCKQVNLPTDLNCSKLSTDCKISGCNAGACVATNVANGTSCDTNTLACDGTAQCSNGNCAKTGPKPLNDGVGCTTGVCQEPSGNVIQQTDPTCQPCTALGQCTKPPGNADLVCTTPSCGVGDAGECKYTLKTSGNCGAPAGTCFTQPTCDASSRCTASVRQPIASCCLTDSECQQGNTDKCTPKVCNPGTHKCENGSTTTCAATCTLIPPLRPAVQKQKCEPSTGACVDDMSPSACNLGDLCFNGTCTGCTQATADSCESKVCGTNGKCCAVPTTDCTGNSCSLDMNGCPSCTCGANKSCQSGGAGGASCQ